ncbi:DUF397 domain-containing protein [Actinoplanes sp. NPDC051513]|uniref:DUF397 domain-containing protein n=1 Tax=Actinoplanes sp. NPDC051513 TaxID=3363908 RepID=UPI0037943F5D
MSISKFTNWFKSSDSDGASNCVETAFAADGTVGVRHSKNPTGPVIEFSPTEWDAFITGVKNSEFDRNRANHS